MKTLGRLKLKEEKMLNSEELLNIRGGSGSCGECSSAYNGTWAEGCRPCHGGGYYWYLCDCEDPLN